MPTKKKRALAKPKQAQPPADKTLLAGWMPKEWWGETPPQMPRGKEDEAPGPPPAKTHGQIPADFIANARKRLDWIRAIVRDSNDNDHKRNTVLPIPLDLDTTLQGEKYFLILCQALYREGKIKKDEGEQLGGEDLVTRLVYWWADDPLTPALLKQAIQNTSLEDNERWI